MQTIWRVSDTKWYRSHLIFKSPPQEGETIVSWPSWKLRAGKPFSESPGSENLRIKSLWFLQTLMRAIKIIKTMDLSGTVCQHFPLSPSALARRSCGAAIYTICYHFRQVPRVISYSQGKIHIEDLQKRGSAWPLVQQLSAAVTQSKPTMVLNTIQWYVTWAHSERHVVCIFWALGSLICNSTGIFPHRKDR